MTYPSSVSLTMSQISILRAQSSDGNVGLVACSMEKTLAHRGRTHFEFGPLYLDQAFIKYRLAHNCGITVYMDCGRGTAVL